MIIDFDKCHSGGGGGGSVTVIDRLDSTSKTSALSANQGRILNAILNGEPTEASRVMGYVYGSYMDIVHRMDAWDRTDSKIPEGWDKAYAWVSGGEDVPQIFTQSETPKPGDPVYWVEYYVGDREEWRANGVVAYPTGKYIIMSNTEDQSAAGPVASYYMEGTAMGFPDFYIWTDQYGEGIYMTTSLTPSRGDKVYVMGEVGPVESSLVIEDYVELKGSPLANKQDRMTMVAGWPEDGFKPNVLYFLQVDGNEDDGVYWIDVSGGMSPNDIEEYHFILSVYSSPRIIWRGLQMWAGSTPEFTEGVYEVSVMAGMGIATMLNMPEEGDQGPE